MRGNRNIEGKRTNSQHRQSTAERETQDRESYNQDKKRERMEVKSKPSCGEFGIK